MIKILSPAQTNILLFLARYKFLTTSQLLTLGVSKRRSNLSVMLKPLKESKRPFIGEMEFAFVPSKGRLENFYYLKPKGKKLLLDSGIVGEEDIRIPKGRTVMFTQDYFHRKYTIDCHIACDISAKKYGIQILGFDRYFDKTGNNRTRKNLQAKTKLEIANDYLIADATLLVAHGQTSRLFALELYNDTNTKRITDQIFKHIQGIRESSLCKNYNIQKGHRLLAVFTHPEVIAHVKNRLGTTGFDDFLLFNDYASVTNDFFGEWESLSKKSVRIQE